MGFLKHLFETTAIYAKRDVPKFEDYMRFGTQKFDRGDYEGAIADYSIAIEANPVGPAGWGARAAAKDKIGDLAGAIEDLNHQIDLIGSLGRGMEIPLALLLVRRGTLSVRLKHYDDAFKDYKLATTLCPDNAEFEAGLEIIQAQLNSRNK